MRPRRLFGWLLAAAMWAGIAASATAQEPAQTPKPLKPGEECSVPDSPATVARRELHKRTETYVSLSAMTIGNALHDVDRYWQGRERALLARLAAAMPRLPRATPGRDGTVEADQRLKVLEFERLEEISDGCRILAGSNPAACDEYWDGLPALMCHGWLAVRDLPLGDASACDAVAEAFRGFCQLKVEGPKAICPGAEGVVAEACITLGQARDRDWSHGCQGLTPNDCIGLLSALSLYEGDAACDRLPPKAPVSPAPRRALPDPTREICLAVVRGEAEKCPRSVYPNMRAKPVVLAEILSGREGAHLAIAGSSRSPSICRVVSVITQAGAVLSVETEVVRTDNASHVRALRPLRPQIDPFVAEVSVETVCAPVLSWGTTEDPAVVGGR